MGARGLPHSFPGFLLSACLGDDERQSPAFDDIPTQVSSGLEFPVVCLCCRLVFDLLVCILTSQTTVYGRVGVHSDLLERVPRRRLAEAIAKQNSATR